MTKCHSSKNDYNNNEVRTIKGFTALLFILCLPLYPLRIQTLMLRMIRLASEGAHPEGSNRYMLSHVLVEQSCLATEKDWLRHPVSCAEILCLLTKIVCAKTKGHKAP